MDLSRGRRATLAGKVAAALLLLTTPGLAQPAPGDYTDDPTLPAGRRGERIRQVLDAVNSGERAPIEALVKDAFGGPFREMPLEQHLDALGWASTTAAAAWTSTASAATRRRSPERPRGGDREEPAHRGVAGALVHVRRHARGAHHRAADPAGAAAEGRAPAPAAHRRRRRWPSSTRSSTGWPRRRRSRARALLARDGRVVFEAARGIADRNHGVADASRHQAQPGLDGQDVHGGGGRPARRRGQALLPGPRREVPRREGLDEGRPLEGAHRAPAQPHLGPRLLLQRDLRADGAPAAAQGRRLQAARGRGDARLRAGHAAGSTATPASCSPGP